MKKYDLRKIMLKAWQNYRKSSGLTFGECLHRAWLSAKAEEVNAKRIADAKAAAGIEEEANTWAGWKQLGYEVIHVRLCSCHYQSAVSIIRYNLLP